MSWARSGWRPDGLGASKVSPGNRGPFATVQEAAEDAKTAGLVVMEVLFFDWDDPPPAESVPGSTQEPT